MNNENQKLQDNNKNSLYQNADEIGREFFAQFLIQNNITEITFEDPQSNFDIRFKDKENKKYVVEIKVRDIQYKDYVLHMLEPLKYRTLLWDGDIPIYACFFGDNYLYLYNENAIRKHTREDVYRAVSTVDTKRGYEKSLCFFVQSKNAKKYKLDENGKWVNYK
jgi:hypothetical protein